MQFARFVLKTLIFLIILISGSGLFLFSLKNVLSYIQTGKSEDRSDNKKQRIKNTIIIAFLQSKILRQKFAGTLHLIIFWGFLVLFLTVIEGFIGGFISGFSFSFLGFFYDIITFIQDIFGLLITIVVIVSIIRRYVFTPERLRVERESKLDATVILSLILLVMFTMYGYNIEKILLGESEGYRPVSLLMANLFSGNGSEFWREFFWWSHNIIILGFLNFLPYSKHFHVLSSVPNTYLSNYKIDAKGIIKPINFEDETIQQYGTRDIEDLTWKQLLDCYSCTECGRCTDACPANYTGKKLNPKIIVKNVRARVSEKCPALKKKFVDEKILNRTLIHNYTTKEELWACTTCSACVEECPVMIDHLTTIIEMRRNLTMMESDFPQEINTVFKNLESNGSPWAFRPEARDEWIEEFAQENGNLHIKKLCGSGTAKELDYVFWVGCAGAFDKRYRNVTKAFAKIMTQAGIKFGVLGSEERCNGDTARRLGNEFLAQQLIIQNIETFRKYEIKKIVTACPHCYNSLKSEYKQFGAELEVIHHSELIQQILNKNKINLKQSIKDINITYHDSCYLGRYNNLYSQPRNVLKNINGVNLREMKRKKDKGFCCGAGGGRMFMEETEGKRVNNERTEEALDTGAECIASACPFCMTMLSDGVKAIGQEEKIKIQDIAEIVSERLIK